MNRVKAAGIHFAISIAIIAVFLTFVYFIWYGQIYAELLGLSKPISLLVLIDVVLGPLLTLLIYKKNKRLWRLDLSLIVFLQAVAFSYGAYTCYLGKPTLVVLKKNAFEIIIEKDVKRELLSREVVDNLSVFSKPHYGYIPLDETDIFKMAVLQQKDIENLSFDIPFLKERGISQARVMSIMNIDEPALVTLLNITLGTVKQASFYLINNEAWFVILVVNQQNLTPFKILYPPEND